VAAAPALVARQRLLRRVTELEKRSEARPRTERAASAPDGAAPAAGTTPAAPAAGERLLAPDGSPYVSLEELKAFAHEAGVEPGGIRKAATAADAPAVPSKTLEEVATEMNLSAGEEANLRNILRETEEEMLQDLFGDKPLEDIKREAREAKDDPDKQAEMVQGIAQHAIQNLGKIATLEMRRKKRVTSVLGKDRAEQFLAKPMKPVLDPELEDVLKNGFN
jgi:hypothetical protein